VIVLELQQPVYVITPRGEGYIWLVTEYGVEMEKIFTIILNSGEIWEYRNNQIRVSNNVTMGRDELQMQILRKESKDKSETRA